MESYLGRCLDSLLIKDTKLMQALDIIVVNDGSQDGTSAIAHNYALTYPDSIRVIDKDNGHYGSCINTAIATAIGKYFRILDADDWIDGSELVRFLAKLKEIDTDVIFTKYRINYPDRIVEVGSNVSFDIDKVYDLTADANVFQFFFMHQITYRTAFIKSIGYSHSEGICYTDIEYTYYPLASAKNIIFFDITLYNYYIGRDDQSMSLKSQYRNRNHMKIIADRMLHEPIPCPNVIAKRLKKIYLTSLYSPYFINSLCVKKPTKDEDKALRETLIDIRNADDKLYSDILSLNISHIKPVKLWNKSALIADIVLLPMRLYKFNKYYK